MERREFIKLAAMAAANAALVQSTAASALDSGVVYDKAPCRFCGTGCHVQVGVKGGRVVSIAGDRKAEVNKGLLCVKGHHVGSRDRSHCRQDCRQARALRDLWQRAMDDPGGLREHQVHQGRARQ
jgi:predicted molibdopterin-dependent oxidoreductase YjgC